MPNSSFTTFLGDTGPKGAPGGNITIYSYNHETGASTDPNIGRFSFFESGLANVSNVYVHRTGLGSVNHEAWISGLDDSSSSVKGSLRFYDSGNALDFALFDITGSVVGHTGVTNATSEYYSIPSQFVYSSSPQTNHAASGVFLDNDSVVVSFSRAGDLGSIGPQGAQGTTGPQGASYGPQGPQGPQGIVGPSGATGITGPQGTQGLVGALGPQGIVGPSGATGITGPLGPQGIQGPQGVTGIVGPSGATGVGLIGPQGPQGDQGPQGPASGPQGPAGIISGGGFLAYKSADQTIPTNVKTTIQFETESFDSKNDYDVSTYSFSPDISGTYLVHSQVTTDSAPGSYDYNYNPTISLERTRGATTTILSQDYLRDLDAFYTTTDRISTISTFADLYSGDILKVDINPSDSSSLYVKGGFSKSYFGAHILGGPPGPIGLIGPQGVTGISGAIGAQGDAGPQGPQGPSGLSGLAFVGSDGTQGPQGPQGFLGPTGLTGPSGSDFVGSTGPQGPQGLQGVVGYTTGAGFFAYRSGQVDYSISGATNIILQDYSVDNYVGTDYTAGFDTQNDWSAGYLDSGLWKPSVPGKYLIKASTRVNNYIDSGEYAHLSLRMTHGGQSASSSNQILSEKVMNFGHPSESSSSAWTTPTLDTSVITNVVATGEVYFGQLYLSESGVHTLEGASYDTFFSAHALGGVRGADGPVGPIGNVGDQGSQGASGPQGPGGLAYQTVVSDTQMISNVGYVVNNSSANDRLILTLPTGNSSNGRIEVVGKTLGGWRVAQNAEQKIIFGYMETVAGSGGYIESSHNNDFVKLVCLSTGSYPSEFAVAGSVGSIIVY